MSTHYLRFDNYTIVDIEATQDDISCVVPIRPYTIFLLGRGKDIEPGIVAHDFDRIQEIRAELFEGPFGNNFIKESPDDLAERRCKQLADKYGLDYVTD